MVNLSWRTKWDYEKLGGSYDILKDHALAWQKGVLKHKKMCKKTVRAVKFIFVIQMLAPVYQNLYLMRSTVAILLVRAKKYLYQMNSLRRKICFTTKHF